jgi:hypothetical protein
MPYVYTRPYVYYFGQIFQALRLFQSLQGVRSQWSSLWWKFCLVWILEIGKSRVREAWLLGDVFQFLPYVWFRRFLYISIPLKKIIRNIFTECFFDRYLKREQGGWCNLLWDNDSKELLRKPPSNIYGSNFIMEKNKNLFWFVNNSEYHHWEMGLESSSNGLT